MCTKSSWISDGKVVCILLVVILWLDSCFYRIVDESVVENFLAIISTGKLNCVLQLLAFIVVRRLLIYILLSSSITETQNRLQ